MLLAVALLAQSAVELPAPEGADLAKPFRVVRADGVEVPAQAHGRSVVLLTTDGEHRLEAVAPADFPKVELKDDGRSLTFSSGGRTIVRYNYAHVEPPSGVDPVFGRSGYLHPVWNPAGQTVSNDHPPKHLHHHGLWFPWTSSEFEGRKSDFWNSKLKQGKVEFVKMEETFSGPVFAGLRARHRFVNLNGPDGPKPALDETWEVRVYPAGERFVFDLTSTQTCASDSPLVVKKYHYGGLGFRGSGDWEGKTGCEFLTSEGKTRKDGHATTARWAVMLGKLDGKETSIGFLGHPSNFRHPQGMRIHPDEPFFNWCPAQGGDFSIEPGKPYVSRYRFVVASEALGAEEMDGRWKAWAEPQAALK